MFPQPASLSVQLINQAPTSFSLLLFSLLFLLNILTASQYSANHIRQLQVDGLSLKKKYQKNMRGYRGLRHELNFDDEL